MILLAQIPGGNPSLDVGHRIAPSTCYRTPLFKASFPANNFLQKTLSCKTEKIERFFQYGAGILYPARNSEAVRVDYTTVMRWIRTGILPVETIREGRRNRH